MFSRVIDDAPTGLNRKHLEQIVKFMQQTGEMTDLKIASSNAGSAVFLSNDKEDVYQYFQSLTVVDRIVSLMSEFVLEPRIETSIYICKGFGRRLQIHCEKRIEYSIFDYISKFQLYIPRDHLIVWEKMRPLNMMKKERLREFVVNNLLKLLWDIGRALYGLHNKYQVVHNDCRIDNIGITNQGNFALFDFDGSVKIGERDIYSRTDYDMLVKSIGSVSGDVDITQPIFFPGEKINLGTSLVKYVAKGNNNDYNYAYDYLENLTIVY